MAKVVVKTNQGVILGEFDSYAWGDLNSSSGLANMLEDLQKALKVAHGNERDELNKFEDRKPRW